MQGSNARLFLGLALGLVLGIAAGWALASRVTPERKVTGALAGERRASVAPASERAALLPAASPLANEPRREAPAPAKPLELSSARVDELVASVAPSRMAQESGTGTIGGRVVDKRDVGVADVVVRAARAGSALTTLDPTRIGAPPPPLDDLQTAVRDAARRHAELRARTFETRTDAQGAYLLEGLPEGTYRITAYKAERVIETRDGASSEVVTGGALELVALPVLHLPVSVTRADGIAVERALISCTRKDVGQERTQSYDWSPSAPELRLPPGKYELTALADVLEISRYRAGIASALRSEPHALHLEDAAPIAPIALVLAGRSGIHGKVRFAHDGITGGGSPSVKIVAMGAAKEIEQRALVESEIEHGMSSDGEFAFLDLEPGRYAVGVVRWSEPAACVSTVVEVGDEIARCELAVPPRDLERYLSVRVSDARGEVLDNVRFQFQLETAGSSRSSGSMPLRGPGGLRLVLIPGDAQDAYFGDAAGWRFSLEMRHPDYGAKTIELTPGQTELEVSFTLPAQLEVVLAGHAENGNTGHLSVRLGKADEEPSRLWMSGRNEQRASSSGTVLFDAVEPGEYDLWLSLLDSGEAFGEPILIHVQRIRLASGPNSVLLPIPSLYPVTVRCGDKATGQLSIRPRGAAESTHGERIGASFAQVDADGVAHLAAIPGGSYTVSLWNAETRTSTERDIEVPCGEVSLSSD